MDEQLRLDKEIEIAKIEYDIDAVNSQLKEQKKRTLEAQKSLVIAKSKTSVLTVKLEELTIQLEIKKEELNNS